MTAQVSGWALGRGSLRRMKILERERGRETGGRARQRDGERDIERQGEREAEGQRERDNQQN